MSSPLDRDLGPDEPSPFAPKWVRDAAQVGRRGTSLASHQTIDDEEAQAPSPAPEEGLAIGRYRAPRFPDPAEIPPENWPEERLAIDRFRVPRFPDPTEMPPEPWPVPRPRTGTGMFVRYVAAIAIGAIGALFVVGKFPPWTIAANDHKEQAPSFGSRFSGQNAGTAVQTKPPVAQLSLSREATRVAGEASPLGISLSGEVESASIVVEGLARGATVTAGQSLGTNTWRIPVADLRNALLRPPRDYSGPMDLVIELRLADDTVADRKFLHLDWAAAAPSGHTKSFPSRKLERDEIADLVKRGEAFVASGDLASARLVLQRAAEAGDSKAALTLAETYDPITLEKLGILGVSSDIGKARAWYELAKEFGSAEAQRRLEMLVSRDH